METSKLIVKKKATKKDGTTPIYIQYSYSREKRTLLNTQKSIEPKNWNFDKGEIRRSYSDANALNAYLQMLKTRITNIVDTAITEKTEPTVEYVKSKFDNEVLLKKPQGENESFQVLNLFQELERFIDVSSSRVTKGVVRQYKVLMKYLLQFRQDTGFDLNFDSIKYNFYLQFKEYLQYEYKKVDGEKGLAVNTIGKQIKNLKAFLRDCMKREIIAHIDLSDFKAIKEEVDSIYLNEKEIQAIAELDLSKYPVLDKCRDLLIIGCETGLRFSDFIMLKSAHIKGNFIWKKTKKTHQQVVIPISDLLQKVLDKYENSPPNNISNPVFNRYIKKVGDIAKIHEEVIIVRKKGNSKVEEVYYKYELITSHTCRRSFCTNQFYKGMPSLLIRKISGHRTEASFLKYIKVNEEAAARKMLEYWNQERA